MMDMPLRFTTKDETLLCQHAAPSMDTYEVTFVLEPLHFACRLMSGGSTSLDLHCKLIAEQDLIVYYTQDCS